MHFRIFPSRSLKMIPGIYWEREMNEAKEIKKPLEKEHFEFVTIRKIAPSPMEVIRTDYPAIWKYLNILDLLKEDH